MEASLDIKPEDKRLLQELERGILEISAKRRFVERRSSLEQKVKRIRRQAGQDELTDSRYAQEIRQRAGMMMEEAVAMFWKEMMPEVIEYLASIDFDRAYQYMVALPVINNELRNNDEYWRRRLILEYPHYFMLSCIETGELKDWVVDNLLSQAVAGSGPRSRRPTAKDALYLLYQKARRLTRYINRVASGEIKASNLNLDSYQEIDFPVPDGNRTISENGRFVVSYEGLIGRETGLPTAMLTIFDMAWMQSVVITGPAPDGGILIPRVEIGGEYALLHWKSIQEINVINLSTRKWLFPAPANLQNGLQFSGARLEGILPTDQVEFSVTQDNDTVGHALEIVALNEWVTDMQRGNNWPLEEYGKWRGFNLPGRSVLIPDNSTPDPEFKMVLSNPWLSKPIKVRGAFDINSKIERANFRNSYERPILYEKVWGAFNVLTDGLTVRPAEPYDYIAEYSIEVPTAPNTSYAGQIMLRDRSDDMRNYGAAVLFTLKNNPGWSMAGQIVTVYANYICVVVPNESKIMVFDLWDWYRSNQGSEPERRFPLLGAEVLESPPLLCARCETQPAKGTCSDCQSTPYCSENCQRLDQEKHQLLCNLKK